MTKSGRNRRSGGDAGPETAISKEERRRLVAIAAAEYAARRRRETLIAFDYFAEPAWDIMLDLYVEQHCAGRVPLVTLLKNVPAAESTILRWTALLVEDGLATVRSTKGALQDTQVSLTESGCAEMERYLRTHLAAAPTDEHDRSDSTYRSHSIDHLGSGICAGASVEQKRGK